MFWANLTPSNVFCTIVYGSIVYMPAYYVGRYALDTKNDYLLCCVAISTFINTAKIAIYNQVRQHGVVTSPTVIAIMGLRYIAYRCAYIALCDQYDSILLTYWGITWIQDYAVRVLSGQCEYKPRS